MASDSKPKAERPPKEVLEKLIKEKGYRYAGEQYGVSDNTARRWMMAYGVELEVKCELKARERQGYKKIGDKFIYDKDLNPDIQKKAKAPKEKVAKENIRVIKEKIVPTKVKKEYVKRQVSEPVISKPEVKPQPSEFAKTINVEQILPIHTPVHQVVEPAPVVRPAVMHPVVDFSKIKNRYSPAELLVFKARIEVKIKEGVEDILTLKDSLSRTTENGTDDTASSGNMFEEGTASMERENLTELLAKKQMHLNALKVSLMRIGNGTYGICVVTGNLIPKERLLAVPHATKCVEAKKDSDNGKVVTPLPEDRELEPEEKHLLD